MVESRPSHHAMLTVVTTLPDRRRARAMARALVERRLAACVHWWPIESCYRWRGELQQEREYRLVCKTMDRDYEALAAAIAALHCYEVPALYAVPVARSSPSYAHWVAENCREPRAGRRRSSPSPRTASARTGPRGRPRQMG